MTRALAIRGVHKAFTTGARTVPVLGGITVSLEAGELVCLLGASGCGKSTLLRIIAGLDTADGGEVAQGDAVLRGPGVDRGLVFQEPRLFPWLDVEDNVGFGLARRDRRGDRVRAQLRLVGLAGFERAYPHQLSGGMAQRAALARALVNRPAVLLLDEPFGALDALTRAAMQEELLRVHAHERFTGVLVTHDVEEAAFLADRVVVLSPRPAHIHAIHTVGLARPRDRLAAAFAAERRQLAALLEAAAATG